MHLIYIMFLNKITMNVGLHESDETILVKFVAEYSKVAIN